MDVEDLRVAVYGSFARTGRAPDVAELTERFGASDGDIRGGLRELHRQRHVALDDDDRVLMAHPFTSVPLGFAVMGASTLWWGGCAWDSFALPHLLPDEPEVLVSTRCPGCGTPHAWNVTREAPPDGKQVAHFLVPVAHMWDDVVHTCGHQRLFCDEACVEGWLLRTGNERGYVMDLPTLWRMARHWYAGRLDHGYRRREPAEAAEYFREVGLKGAFWGLSG
ncbi:organomercurial lyase [Actinomadura sp. 9N407]|uniref:organomercurial lyase n=1 Tax=Actinomadura sp. 9N407 TaxID=3375154 RepID=UPI0037B343F0